MPWNSTLICIVFIFWDCLKCMFTEGGKKRERTRASVWFESSSTWVGGRDLVLGHLLFPRHSGGWSDAEPLGLLQVLLWDAGIAGCGSPCCATMLGPLTVFSFVCGLAFFFFFGYFTIFTELCSSHYCLILEHLSLWKEILSLLPVTFCSSLSVALAHTAWLSVSGLTCFGHIAHMELFQ